MTFENAYRMDPLGEALYYYILSEMNDISYQKLTELSGCFGSLTELFTAKEEILRRTALLSEPQISKIRFFSGDRAVRHRFERMLSSDIRMIPFYDNEYPVLLREIKDPPVSIFLKGELPGDYMPVISVIGARNCTGYGESVARRIGELAGASGIGVVSGMARGIDSMSQIGALDAGGYSLAVLGGGTDVIYPRESLKLYRSLEERGGILSEHVPGTQPLKPYFAARNRLISGLSDAVCVIEAREKSGTLITVDCALDQGREVYALPGRIIDHTSYGTNELIRQGAAIITDVPTFIQDILKKYGIMRQIRMKGRGDTDPALRILSSFSDIQKQIISCFDGESFTLDSLGRKCGVPGLELLGICLELSERGILMPQGAGRFKVQDKGMELKNALETG